MDTDRNIKNRLNRLGILKTNEPLKKYTSFKTGGPADFLIWPGTRDSLREIVFLSREHSIPLTVLGGCSNLLVGDRGIRGIVIMMNAFYSKGIIKINGNGSVYSDSIVKKEDFIRYCLDAGFEGMEFMAGVPGCIGGGIIMNAGTVHGFFGDILESIDYMDMEGRVTNKEISRDMIAYRGIQIPRDGIVLGGFFKLIKTEDLQRVQRKIEDILSERKAKHPLGYPSAGSVFKNPDGFSAWNLVEDSDLKGKRIGGAGVSELHTNFIINLGKATSRDILDLIDNIKEKVYTKFNVSLETEIRVIGEF